MPKPDYDTSLARMAGNIASGIVHRYTGFSENGDFRGAKKVARISVEVARAIIAEIKAVESVDPETR